MGNWRNRHYSPEWVYRLRDMVARNLSLPHKFVCLSNTKIPGVEVVPLKQDWPGWWSKIELFAPPLEGRVLYLDLDVLVTGALDELVQHPAPLVFMPPHPVLMGEEARPPGRGIIYEYQTSCMAWTVPEGREIYERFTPDVMTRFRGDQDWIAHIKPGCPTFPKEWFRKLRQCPEGPPEGVKVVVGDGKFKNNTAPWPWVRDCWVGRPDESRQ